MTEHEQLIEDFAELTARHYRQTQDYWRVIEWIETQIESGLASAELLTLYNSIEELQVSLIPDAD